MISTKNLNEVRKQIHQLKKQKKQIIIQADTPEFNRKILENPDIDLILDLEFHERKDFMKQRDSGLNEIMCKLAAKNRIKIGINLKRLKKLKEKDKAIILARIIQNIKLCRKNKTPITIYPKTSSSKQEIKSFLMTLGASTQQIKDCNTA
jgi:RNase P/RNase MRP subunit p30